MATFPAQYLSGSIAGLTPEDIANMGASSVIAIQKALSSGVEEYAIGSRRLKRYQLSELLEALRFSQNAGAAISPDGTVSAIQSRRGVPCDV
jgi:hypothetical protein